MRADLGGWHSRQERQPVPRPRGRAVFGLDEEQQWAHSGGVKLSEQGREI